MKERIYSARQYLIFGIFYLLLGVFILWRNAYFSISDYSIFWFCDFIPFVLAIAFIWKNDNLVKGVNNVGFFPQIIFILGAFMMIFFSIDIFGIGLNLEHLSPWFILTSVILHLSLVGSYFLNYKVKPTYKCLLYSLALLIGMYLVAISQTPIDENVNYVFIFDKIGLYGMTFLYIPLVFFIVVLPTFIFQVLMNKLWIYNKKRKN